MNILYGIYFIWLFLLCIGIVITVSVVVYNFLMGNK